MERTQQVSGDLNNSIGRLSMSVKNAPEVWPSDFHIVLIL